MEFADRESLELFITDLVAARKHADVNQDPQATIDRLRAVPSCRFCPSPFYERRLTQLIPIEGSARGIAGRNDQTGAPPGRPTRLWRLETARIDTGANEQP